VIHRDIKPENIMFQAGHAVVADFGIARAVDAAGGDRLTETGLAVGTPFYMSPEQSSGTQDVDGRADLYSLGCVAYEMLGGEPPFTGPTPRAILARHSVDPVPNLRTLRSTVSDPMQAARP
jgi:serine/threonine-protein kinase